MPEHRIPHAPASFSTIPTPSCVANTAGRRSRAPGEAPSATLWGRVSQLRCAARAAGGDGGGWRPPFRPPAPGLWLAALAGRGAARTRRTASPGRRARHMRAYTTRHTSLIGPRARAADRSSRGERAAVESCGTRGTRGTEEAVPGVERGLASGRAAEALVGAETFCSRPLFSSCCVRFVWCRAGVGRCNRGRL